MARWMPLPYGKCGHNINVCTCEHFVYDDELTWAKDRQAHEAAAKLRAILKKERDEKDKQ